MPTYQTTGIVIGRTNFGEADRIVRLLTPDRGKLSAVAKGVRRIKSRSGGHLELLGEVSLSLATGRNLDVITAARLIWYPHQLAAAYERLNLAFMMARTADRLAPEGQPQPKLFATLASGLRAVDGGAGGPLPQLWFKLQAAEHLGYRPELERCLVCGRRDAGLAYAFSAERGGLVCSDDAHMTDRPMPHEAIKLWRLLCDYPYATVAQIRGASQLAAAGLPQCDEFFVHHFGQDFQVVL